MMGFEGILSIPGSQVAFRRGNDTSTKAAIPPKVAWTTTDDVGIFAATEQLPKSKPELNLPRNALLRSAFVWHCTLPN